MAYISLDDLRGRIPEDFLIEALDDDGDGVIDAWTDVEQGAADAVDAYLSVLLFSSAFSRSTHRETGHSHSGL